MKLNHECIRDVLLYLESASYINIDIDGIINWSEINATQIYEALADYSKEDVYYSLHNLEQAGYITAQSFDADNCVVAYLIKDITFIGHEFLEKIRDDNHWKSIKTCLSAVRNYSLSAISSIAEGVTKAAISNYFNHSDSI